MNRIAPFAATFVWLGALGAGMGIMMEYDARPGSPGTVADVRSETAASVAGECILFLHPKCPCARDTLIALARSEYHDPSLRLRIIFVGPTGADEEWWSGRNWELAKRIRGAVLERDGGGVAARSYGVRTSGHALVYGKGSLRFSGGLAPPRDESPFELTSGLPNAPAECVRRPVRGCQLFDE